MSKHVPIIDRPHSAGPGRQRIYRFENGYGASVVRFASVSGYGSYTSNEGEWEVAVLVFDGDSWGLTYETPITDDVIGHVLDSELDELLGKISALPAKAGAS